MPLCMPYSLWANQLVKLKAAPEKVEWIHLGRSLITLAHFFFLCHDNLFFDHVGAVRTMISQIFFQLECFVDVWLP